MLSFLSLQDLYHRIMDKGTIKMKGYVAIQRKILVLMYTLWKNNEAYNNIAIIYLEQPQSEGALIEMDQSALHFSLLIKVKNYLAAITESAENKV